MGSPTSIASSTPGEGSTYTKSNRSSVRQRQAVTYSVKKRLKKAEDEASYFKEKCRELDRTSKQWKNEAQNMTHNLSFGAPERPQTPRSASRKVNKSPKRRKHVTRRTLSMSNSKTNHSLHHIFKGMAFGIMIYFLWKTFLNGNGEETTVV